MRKNKWICAIWALVIMALVSGCGSTDSIASNDSFNDDSSLPSLLEISDDSSTTESSQQETTTDVTDSDSSDNTEKDLVGQWVQKNPNSTYMVADIRKDGKIGVFFILEDDDQPWTYWVGTYDTPQELNDKYTWESRNTYTGNGLLSSSAETKKFTYENGIITFEVTIQGETHDVHLIRGEWDTSAVPQNAYEEKKEESDYSQANSEQENELNSQDILEVTDSGWYLSKKNYLHYYMKIHNKSTDIVYSTPTIRVTARDANGILLDTEEHTLSVIYPGCDFVVGDLAFQVDEIPTTVDFEMVPPDKWDLEKMTGEYVPFEIRNTALREDKIVGEVFNLNNKDYRMVYVVAICRDANGNFCATEIDFPDNLSAHGSVPFSINVGRDNNIASYEVYAYEW